MVVPAGAVTSVLTWQLAQPMASKMAWPWFTCAVIGPRGGTFGGAHEGGQRAEVAIDVIGMRDAGRFANGGQLIGK